jgi:hypothetical protein
MSNYPDGMTRSDWAHIDGGDHHDDCPQSPDYEFFCVMKEDGQVYDGHGRGEICDEMHDECSICESINCRCDCDCENLFPSKYDIELERLGL